VQSCSEFPAPVKTSVSQDLLARAMGKSQLYGQRSDFLLAELSHAIRSMDPVAPAAGQERLCKGERPDTQTVLP
jgi:hypothetical protein